MTDISSIFKGSRITLPSSADLRLNASTWVIEEILYDNRVDGVSEPSSDPDDQPSGWVAKYLCHDLHFPHTQAFMRVYCQALDEGTEFLPDEDRAKQARPHFEKHEAMALKKFRRGECKSVPSLLGYSQSAQGELGPLPGGYLTHLVWEKVPGEILTPEAFWSFERQERDLIRHIFRAAYK